MKFTGKVTVVGLIREGVSQTGNAYHSQQFVMEEEQGQYPMSIAFDVLNDKVALQKDEVCTVHLSFSVRSKDGKFFTNINAWKKEGGYATAPAQAPVAQPAPAPVAQAAPPQAPAVSEDAPF